MCCAQRPPALTANLRALYACVLRRGMGRQGQLGIFNFVGFWGVGVVWGYYLAFHVGWGLRGLWTGILLGVVVTGCDLFRPASARRPFNARTRAADPAVMNSSRKHLKIALSSKYSAAGLHALFGRS